MQLDHERQPPERVHTEPSEPFTIPDRVPVFPLPNVVFFPKTYLPLHIFEPRYRQMVADATDGNCCIAMALLKEGWEADYYGNPPIYPVLCVGRLVSVQSLPDGRSNILLHGLERGEILEEHFERPYREATLHIEPVGGEEALRPDVRETLVETLGRYLQTKEQGAAWQRFFRDEISDEILVNTLATYLECKPLEKQFLLEADGLHQRSGRLNDLIQFMLHDHHGGKGWE